ncbi:MAG: ectonucleotide pyrophosphatase/phosphodiesterase [Bacteroidales bacterium]
MKVSKLTIIALGLITGFLIISSCSNSRKAEDQPIVIMLSLDGFRWDYPDIYETPNLDKMAAEGVKANSLVPSFPTKTFPNHYSIATGLYPDHHGLVNNTYMDPERAEIFRLGDRAKVEDAYYYGGEPIWVTAEKQGIPTASFFWVGSEAPIQDIQPGIWKKFDSSIPFETRMDSVLSWIDLPAKKRPRLITWYMEEPDHVGHDFGPVSEKTGQVISYLDSLLGVFIERLYSKDLDQEINFIVLSDHGMGETKGNMYIDIDANLKAEWIQYILGYNPVIFIEPEDGYADSVLMVLNKEENLSAWKKSDLPEHLNYGNNPRISEIVVAADSGWSIGTDDIPDFEIGGAHGYDYRNKDMHAIFYAMGPAFKKAHSHPSFYNVDIYLLLADILNLEPAETDGNQQRIVGMLKEE